MCNKTERVKQNKQIAYDLLFTDGISNEEYNFKEAYDTDNGFVVIVDTKEGTQLKHTIKTEEV